MAASMREVAALAGVSMGTISNVLNKPDMVSAATRERVEAAIAQLGFVRNDAARQLRAGQSRMLAVVVLDARNPFFLDVAAGAESVADVNDLLTVIVGSGESEERENRQLRLLMEQRVQGILLSPVGENVPMLDNLDRQGTPVVLLDRGSHAPGRSSVAVDDVLGGVWLHGISWIWDTAPWSTSAARTAFGRCVTAAPAPSRLSPNRPAPACRRCGRRRCPSRPAHELPPGSST